MSLDALESVSRRLHIVRCICCTPFAHCSKSKFTGIRVGYFSKEKSQSFCSHDHLKPMHSHGETFRVVIRVIQMRK